MSESPDNGPAGKRTARSYFEHLARAGFDCDAKDGARRTIVVVCTGPEKHRIRYLGDFVGAGYLELTQVIVDGRILNKAGLIDHQTDVWTDNFWTIRE